MTICSRWLPSPETAAPDAFVERKKLEAYLESSDREKIADAVIAHCWVPRVIADNILRLNNVEPDWKAAIVQVDDVASLSSEKLVKPKEGRSPKSQALSRGLDEVFPSGVPEGALLSFVREKLMASIVVKTRGLKASDLQNGKYDTTIKRLLGRTAK
jgi:hypothetical protein